MSNSREITVRIPDQMVERLDIQCRRLKRSRSQVITDRLSEWFIYLEWGEPEDEFEHQDDRCRVCGCTDLSACDGGCFWVEPGLCSQCSPAEPEDQVHGAGAELEDQVHGAGTEKQKCPECGSEEIEGGSPRTTYSCGSSDYDQRPGTFQQSICCCWVSNKKTSEA